MRIGKFLWFLPVVLIWGVSVPAFAYSETQTNWSGGEGSPGPVSNWEDDFHVCSHIAFYDTQGQLTLDVSHTTPVEYPVMGGLQGVSSVWATDINGDGHEDLITADEEDGRVFWWENGGGGSSWQGDLLSDDFSGAASVCALDVDDDGDQDIAAVSSSQNRVALWLNLDGSGEYWTRIDIDESFGGGVDIYPADINGDGYDDLVGAAYSDNDIVWWQNVDGSGSDWIKRPINVNFTSAYGVTSADIDNDGKLDVVGVSMSYYSGSACWWRNVDGSGSSWTQYTIDGDIDGARAVAAGYVNADDMTDVVVGTHYSDDVVSYENQNGGYSWASHTIDTNFDQVSALAIADMDGDGDGDVAGTAANGDEVAWFENLNRVGTVWTKRSVSGSLGGASCVFIADIDGNGNSDVAATGAESHELKWWEVVGYSPEGNLVSKILDTGIYAVYETLDWTFSEPTGTDIYFQLRTSNNPGSMGSWSDPINGPGGLIDVDIARYVQYMVTLGSDDYTATPVLQDVTITWQEIGGTMEGSTAMGGFGLAAPAPNPSTGTALLRFGLSGASAATLEVFDCSGRLVRTLVDGELAAGTHQAEVSGLTPGLYLCRLAADGEIATRTLVVIR